MKTVPSKFAFRAGGIALVAGLTVLPWALIVGGAALPWGVLGWASMSAVGLFGGLWLVRAHGRADAGFLVAMGTCMLARLALAAAGASLAATVWGMGAAYAFLVGLAVGYFPMQAYELGWFFKRNTAGDLETLGTEDLLT